MKINKQTRHPLRVIFLGSRPISVRALDVIEKCIKTKRGNWVDLTVFTNSDNNPPKGVSRWWNTGSLEKIAKAKGFKILKSFTDITNKPFDLGINVFSTDIIPESVIMNTQLGITNFHFGYLPTIDYSFQKGSPHQTGKPFSIGTYRGSNVLSHAILGNEKWQAVTFHYISEKIDLGPIIEQQWNSISNTTTAWDLQLASEKKALIILDKYFTRLIDNRQKIKVLSPGNSKYPYHNRLSLQEIKILPSNISEKRLDLAARALSFPNTEPPYFLEKNNKDLPVKRYVIYKKGKGLFIMKPKRKTFIQKLKDIT